MMDKLGDVQKKMADMFTLTRESPIPMGLKKLLYDSFKCKICLSTPMTPPIIFMKCCKSIVGCEACINQWFDGPDPFSKSCPTCNSHRAFSETVRLHGMDDLLTGLRDIVGGDTET